MKTLVIFASFIFLTSFVCADQVRVYTDYTPVRIIKLVEGTDFEIEASKSSLKGKFKDMDENQLPQDRNYRDAWKMKNGSVSVDAVLKSEKDAKASKLSTIKTNMQTAGLTPETIEYLTSAK